MSCQQATEIPDDPYAFTEPPATAIFTSPLAGKFSKLTSIKHQQQIRANGTSVSYTNGINHVQKLPVASVYGKAGVAIVNSAKKVTTTKKIPPVNVGVPSTGGAAATVVVKTPTRPLQPVNHSITTKQQTSLPPPGRTFQSLFQQEVLSSIRKKSSPQRDDTVIAPSTFREPKATNFPATKKTTVKQQNASTRIKRSFSQTAHHEVLQRIPAADVKPLTSKGNNIWHAPESYIFDYESPGMQALSHVDHELTLCAQKHWFVEFLPPTMALLTREQQLEQKASHLRRKAIQYAKALEQRSVVVARKRLTFVSQALEKSLGNHEDDNGEVKKKCCVANCENDSLALTAYCYLHITQNTEQKLFYPCTAKFADNSQCRVPVFDICHELPLCREHAWKRDNYKRMLEVQKPKKLARKKPKICAMTRPLKRNKKKKRSPVIVMSEKNHHTSPLDSVVYNHGGQLQGQTGVVQLPPILQQQQQHPPKQQQFVIANPNAQLTQIASQITTQELLNICENSSAYESSEDTGVGGLSESELIGANDVIEEIALGDTRLLEESELNNVLNQFPEDAFNELFSVQHPDQEVFDRVLEAVDEQVKTLEMTGDSNFLGDFLDVDEQMLEETEISDGLQAPGGSEIRGLVHT